VGALSDHGDKATGALATVSSEGELSLFGALASLDGALVIQAEVSGDAAEAKDLGRELAQDVRDQLSA
jgi:hydroxymethylbilane synthase